MMETLITYGLEILAALLITLIGVAGTWLTLKVSKKQELANIGMAMNQVVQAAQITVGELQQTVVDAIKRDGMKLDEALIKDLGKQLLDKTAAKLSDPTVELLTAAKVDITALITGAGEDWIGKMKA